MDKRRLEAFSDAVIAILITIMVLELKVPSGADLAALGPLVPVFASYVLSFVKLGEYWNNHHHMLQAARGVDGRVLWANLNYLFWLSLMPFTTGWMGEHEFAPTPVAAYGVNLLLAAVGYFCLQQSLIRLHGPDSAFTAASRSERAGVLKGRKGLVTILLYVIAIPLVLISPYISLAIYAGVAMLWISPDRRFAQLGEKQAVPD